MTTMTMTPHESAHLHVTGQARYTDDERMPQDTLHAWIVTAPHARARILHRDAARARAMPGVAAVLLAEDVPGTNRVGPIVRDEPLLAEDEIAFRGQSVALVLADTLEQARLAAAAVEVTYAPAPACLTIAAAIAQERFHGAPHVIARGGDVQAALAAAPVVVRAEIASGGQEHFYLETQSALALPEEDGALRVLSSTQHPTEVQRLAAAVLGIGEHRITSEVRRLGGGFGGKESQASPFAVLAALGAHTTGRAVRLFLNRDQDMQQTGKRHPFWSRYAAGFDSEGRLLVLDVQTFSDGGWSQDLSGPVLDRALFHLDSAYFVPTLRFEGRVCHTDLPSNTAFRGFGGPQGMIVVEDALTRCAERLGLDPARVRARNVYTTAGGRDVAPYGQAVPAPRLERIWTALATSADYDRRRAEIAAFNARSPHLKRGLGYQPVKFGISFTKALLNQAGALVMIYADGTVQVSHGGAEMGQGLHTKMIAVAAATLGVRTEQIRLMVTSTEKVPNTSPTAASSGSDLNGQAVAEACAILRRRLAPVAARLLGSPTPEAVVFSGGTVSAPGCAPLPFAKVTTQAWVERVSMSATGFYATPGVAYDHDAGQGTPFFYFAYGGAVSEVEVSLLTGEHRLLRVDILHDVGDSLSAGIDIGQIEGGFVQGWGWLTCEEVLYGEAGQLLTHSPSTYKIPAAGDVPLDLRVALLEDAREPLVIGGSKAVGEPPFMLAISVVTALRHAIAAAGPPGVEVELSLPCTPEAVLHSIAHQRAAETP